MNFWTFVLAFHGLMIVAIPVMGWASKAGWLPPADDAVRHKKYCPRCGLALPLDSSSDAKTEVLAERRA